MPQIVTFKNHEFSPFSLNMLLSSELIKWWGLQTSYGIRNNDSTPLTWMRKNTLTPPQPSALAKSLPVPNGSTATGSDGLMPIVSSTESTHPVVPSPPHARILKFGTFLYNSNLETVIYCLYVVLLKNNYCTNVTTKRKTKMPYPAFGPPCERSKTCLGFRSHWNFCISLAPWFPPLRGLINTRRGLLVADGMGFITNVLWLSWNFRD